MATFEEALLKERLWTWLEESRGMTVEGEVDLGTGRIDLVAETPDGEYWGIEVKRDEVIRFGSRFYDQAHRYMESEKLDRLYLASPHIEGIQKAFFGSHPPDVGVFSQVSQKLAAGIEAGNYTKEEVLTAIDERFDEAFLERKLSGSPSVHQYIENKLEPRGGSTKDSVSLKTGLRELSRARFPEEVGVIHVPQNIAGGIFYDVERHLDPTRAYEPHILREATLLDRTGEPSFARREEPWIRHCCWREYGGLPEGHVPNVMESDQPSRPIDLLAFPESNDPTDAVLNPALNEVVGIEAKGEASYQSGQIQKQLGEFLQTETLSRLYLAVPESLAVQAAALVGDTPELEPVGVFGISETGDFRVHRRATNQTPIHDGYVEKYSERKIGYGNLNLQNEKPIENPFVTDEEAQRLKNPDAASYARDILKDLSDRTGEDGWIRTSVEKENRPPESEFKKSKTRAYLLRGRSADPYVEGKGIGPRDMKDGYVRLTVSQFTDTATPALKLHFGRGSWEGGYIWFEGAAVEALRDVLVSLQSIKGGELRGYGKVLDLATYPFDYEENEPHRVAGSSGEETVQTLKIESVMGGSQAARIRLGNGETSGADVELSEAQWLDLVATVDILLETGNKRELPGEHSYYPRIGPNGENTWPIGTDIEEQIRPDLATKTSQ
jgi:hypothetical protein